jgi:hypothetical protein
MSTYLCLNSNTRKKSRKIACARQAFRGQAGQSEQESFPTANTLLHSAEWGATPLRTCETRNSRGPRRVPRILARSNRPGRCTAFAALPAAGPKDREPRLNHGLVDAQRKIFGGGELQNGIAEIRGKPVGLVEGVLSDVFVVTPAGNHSGQPLVNVVDNLSAGRRCSARSPRLHCFERLRAHSSGLALKSLGGSRLQADAMTILPGRLNRERSRDRPRQPELSEGRNCVWPSDRF